MVNEADLDLHELKLEESPQRQATTQGAFNTSLAVFVPEISIGASHEEIKQILHFSQNFADKRKCWQTLHFRELWEEHS